MPPEPTKRVLVIGATSAMASEVARRYATEGARLYLTGRNAARLDAVASDLRVRGAGEVATAVLDITDRDGTAEVLRAAWDAFEELDLALVAPGALPDQAECQASGRPRRTGRCGSVRRTATAGRPRGPTTTRSSV